jgi:hypothetical protein
MKLALPVALTLAAVACSKHTTAPAPKAEAVKSTTDAFASASFAGGPAVLEQACKTYDLAAGQVGGFFNRVSRSGFVDDGTLSWSNGRTFLYRHNGFVDDKALSYPDGSQLKVANHGFIDDGMIYWPNGQKLLVANHGFADDGDVYRADGTLWVHGGTVTGSTYDTFNASGFSVLVQVGGGLSMTVTRSDAASRHDLVITSQGGMLSRECEVFADSGLNNGSGFQCSALALDGSGGSRLFARVDHPGFVDDGSLKWDDGSYFLKRDRGYVDDKELSYRGGSVLHVANHGFSDDGDFKWPNGRTLLDDRIFDGNGRSLYDHGNITLGASPVATAADTYVTFDGNGSLRLMLAPAGAGVLLLEHDARTGADSAVECVSPFWTPPPPTSTPATTAPATTSPFPPTTTPSSPGPTTMPPAPPPAVDGILPAGTSFVAVGPSEGAADAVRVFDVRNPGVAKVTAYPFGRSFAGGVRVALADVTGDGVMDLICGRGEGSAAEIIVFDLSNGQSIPALHKLAFSGDPGGAEGSTSGGVYVAAGDIDGDGKAEVVVGAGKGQTPRVRAYNLAGQTVVDMLVYEESFTAGVRVTVGDFNGDGALDIVTGTPPGGGPRVKIIDGKTQAVISDGFVYEDSFRGGVWIAATDVAGDGVAELVTGADVGGGPRVRVLKVLPGGQYAAVQDFFAYDANFRGGTRVGTLDFDGDGKGELAIAAGTGGGPQIRIMGGATAADITSFWGADPSSRSGFYISGAVSARR